MSAEGDGRARPDGSDIHSSGRDSPAEAATDADRRTLGRYYPERVEQMQRRRAAAAGASPASVHGAKAPRP